MVEGDDDDHRKIRSNVVVEKSAMYHLNHSSAWVGPTHSPINESTLVDDKDVADKDIDCQARYKYLIMYIVSV